MASDGYYPPYYNQQQQQPTSRPLGQFPNQAPERYTQGRSAPQAAYQGYPQTYNEWSQDPNAAGWYGSNNTDASLGRQAAEALSALGNAPRHTATTTAGVTPQYQASTYPSNDALRNNHRSGTTAAFNNGGRASPLVPYPNFGRSTPQHAGVQHPARPTSTDPKRPPAADFRNPASARSSGAEPARQYTPQPTHGQGIGSHPGVHSPLQAPVTHVRSPTTFAGQHARTASRPSPQQLPSIMHHQRTNSAQYANQTAHAPLAQMSSYGPPAAPQQQLSEPQSFTVDPSQVYNPWPEYQRRKAAEDAHKAELQAAQAERQLLAEQEIRLSEERARAASEAEEARSVDEAQAVDAVDSAGPAEDVSATTEGKQGKPRKPAAPKKTESSEAPNAPKAPKSGKGNQSGEAKAKQTSAKGTQDGGAAFPAAPADDEDAEMLAMLKALKAKNPERFKRLMEEGEIENPTSASLPTTAASLSTSMANSLISQVQPSSYGTQASTGPHVQQASGGTRSIAQPTTQLGGARSPPVQPALEALNTTTKVAGSKVLWPEDKKLQLAQATVDHLNSHPANKDKRIAAVDIQKILEANPSYVSLCEQLEAKGVTVDRSSLARRLLQAVPVINPTTQKQRKDKDVPAQASSQLAAPPVQPAATPAPHPPSTVAAVNAQDPWDKRKFEPSGAAMAASKEQAARKRTFNELVDLTALSDNDDLPKRVVYRPPLPHFRPPSFHSHFGAPPPNHFPPHVSGTYAPPLAFQRNQPPGPAPFHPHPTNSAMAPNQNTTLTQAPPPPSIDLTFQHANIARPISRSNARRRAAYDSKTIARDVLLATGRHPDMHHLNAHLQSLRVRTHMTSDKTDLASIDWNILDPGDPLPLSELQDDAESGRKEEGAEADDEQDDSDDEPLAPVVHSDPTIDAEAENVGSRETKALVHSKFRLVPTRGRGRGRGRGSIVDRYVPAGHRSEERSDIDGRPGRAAQTPDGTRSHPAHSNNSSPMSGTGYSAFRQLNPDGTKKRGRPVGWRKAIHMDPARQTVADRTKAAKPSKSRDVPDPKPHFQIFPCKWEGCKAQLHNLKTLKAHVKASHTSAENSCRWDDCDTKVMIKNQVTGFTAPQTSRREFKSQDRWWDHLEKAHFKPIAWQMGDGPPSDMSDAFNSGLSDAYLSDSHGRLVTPRVTTPPRDASAQERVQQEPEPVYSGRGRPPVPKRTLEQKASDAEEALRNKKRQIGIGLDRGGATLVNAKRRLGFIDDEDFEAIVDDV